MPRRNKRVFRSHDNVPKPSSSTNIVALCENLTANDLYNPKNSWLQEICVNCHTLDAQIPLIVKAIQVQPHYICTFLEICRNLEQMARERFPHCTIHARAFGSTVTQLAFKDSDIDIFLYFNELPEEPDQVARALRNAVKKRCSEHFKNGLAIFAKVPLFRCVHRSGIQCDVSFTASLGVHNSELIKFYLAIDERVKPFILILKFWLKKQDLIGSNAITSYSLTMLAVYYLQKIGILPTVVYLRSLGCPPEMIAGWDTSFVGDKSRLPPVQNRSSILELFIGFFHLYSTFEFGLYAICPLNGKIILRTAFEKPELLPPEFECFKRYLEINPSDGLDITKYMCVQDPFKLNHNITRNVNLKVLTDFQARCTTALKLCESEIEKAKNKNHKSQFFREFLHCFKNNISKKKKGTGRILILLESVPQGCEENSEEGIRKLWAKEVLEKLQEILTRVLKCTMEKRDVSQEDGDESVQVLMCEMSHHLLLGFKKRGKAKQEFEFPQQISAIEKEAMISDYLCDEVLKSEPAIPLKFSINFYVKRGPTHVLLELEPQEDDAPKRNLAKSVLDTIEEVIPKWVAIALRYSP